MTLGKFALAILIACPGFAMVHPGVMNSKADLDLIKTKIAEGQEPWKSAFNMASADARGQLAFATKTWSTVDCGSGSNPDSGCSDERNAAIAAYTHALLWYFTGDEAHAKKSIQIMDAWSAALKGGHINSNARLQAGWTGSVWPRAAEIIRYTYTGWPAADIEKFKSFLTTQYVPFIAKGSPCENGNWEATDIEALMGIAVFLDDKAMFDSAAGMWRKRTPAYFYLTTDGALPIPPPNCSKSSASLITYWQGQSTLMDGLSQETCRDFGHTGFGFAAIVNAAETAYIQGVDLYGEQRIRLTKAMEFHCGYQNGMAVPLDLCGGKPNLGTGGTWEIAYNHYHNRLGMDLPQTAKLILKQRPTSAGYHIDWETLTHGELGKTSSPIVPKNKPASIPFYVSLASEEIVVQSSFTGRGEIAIYSIGGKYSGRYSAAFKPGTAYRFSLKENPLPPGLYSVRVKIAGISYSLEKTVFGEP